MNPDRQEAILAEWRSAEAGALAAVKRYNIYTPLVYIPVHLDGADNYAVYSSAEKRFVKLLIMQKAIGLRRTPSEYLDEEIVI